MERKNSSSASVSLSVRVEPRGGILETSLVLITGPPFASCSILTIHDWHNCVEFGRSSSVRGWRTKGEHENRASERGGVFRAAAIAQRRLPKFRGEEIGIIVFVLAAAYFVVPSKFLGWHWISARFPLFVLGLALTCTGPLPKWNRGPSFRVAFMTTVGLATIGVNMLLVQEVVRIERDIEEYVSGIDAFQPNSTLLPIALENPKYGTIRPLTRAYEYYHIAKGGANGRGAAKFNTIVPIVYRQYPVERLFPHFPAMNAELWTATKADQLAKTYGYVLLWGRKPTVGGISRKSAVPGRP